MKSYYVSVFYSDLIDAGSKDEAIEKMYERISDGLIKRYEWEFDTDESDDLDE